MAKRRSGRLVILSGPSCAGKSPLVKALARLHPGLHRALQGIVLHNSRAPRPGERDGVDYHFRPRAAIEALREDLGFVVLDVRGDLQALDLAYLAALLRGTRCSRGTPSSARRSSTNPPWPASRRSRPFSPPSPGRRFSTSAPGPGPTSRGWVTDVMRRKLLRRTRKQKGELALTDLQNIETRAGSAYAEMRMAWRFGTVFPNQDGEDSENWDAFYWPLGNARRALGAFVDLLEGRRPRCGERWTKDLLPGE